MMKCAIIVKIRKFEIFNRNFLIETTPGECEK